MAKGTALFKAYMNNTIPSNGGFIICSFFDSDSIYSIYEVTAYKNVKDIYQTAEGLTFKTDGSRTHLLVEPPTYARRYEEPVHREAGKSIPYRFDDLTIITGQKQEKIMIPKEPLMLYTSFTILKTQGENFAFLFYPTEDVYMAIRKFMADSLYNDCGLTKEDALNAAQILLQTVKNFTVFT
jgi:hypothetical protein